MTASHEFALPSDQRAPAPQPPRPVVISFWILLARAALRMLVVALMIGSWNVQIKALLQSPNPVDTTHAQAQTELIASLALQVVFAALYVVFAYLTRRGRNWARLAITAIVVVFAVLGVLSASNIFVLVSVLIELAAVFLLCVKSAKAYFAAVRAAGRR